MTHGTPTSTRWSPPVRPILQLSKSHTAASMVGTGLWFDKKHKGARNVRIRGRTGWEHRSFPEQPLAAVQAALVADHRRSHCCTWHHSFLVGTGSN